MDKIRILHTGDFHLGTNFASIGEAGEKRSKELTATFGNAIELAKESAVDAVVISGDLFDSNDPDSDTVYYVCHKFQEISEIPVFITLGNHDYGCKFDFPRNVHIFGTEIECFHLNDFCDIYGVSFGTRFVTECNIKGFTPEDREKTNIFVLHADLVNGGESMYNPVTPQDLASTGVDYFALGHIHKYSGMQHINGTYYAYCGCPEGRGFDELGEKGVIIAEVAKHSVEYEFVPLCQRKYVEVECDISDCANTDDVVEMVRLKITDSKNLYKIVLVGETNINVNETLIQQLLPQVFYIKIHDRTSERIDVTERSLKGYFIKNARENKRALRYGLAALGGEKVSDE